MKKTLALFMALLFGFSYSQQEPLPHKDSAAETSHGMKGNTRFTFGLGHTHVSEGKIDGDTKWLVIPSFSFNFDYWLSNKVALGLQSDILVESFKIEHNHSEVIEREYPVALIPVIIYKPGQKLSLIGGVGMEFSKGHNLTLTRLGLEYGWHLPKSWELGTALVWDNKWNYYNSWGIAITISKINNKHH